MAAARVKASDSCNACLYVLRNLLLLVFITKSHQPPTGSHSTTVSEDFDGTRLKLPQHHFQAAAVDSKVN